MSLIKVLSENLINQIAAGEVIERPSSAIKELIENSIDAGADSIFVELKDGGKTFIKVTDNGCGMDREDLQLSVQRHATSKISNEGDLWRINTMGFRGEALASIASVSKMCIKSKGKGELSGSQIDINGGEILTIKDVGMPYGTSVEVYNLFFNTPARQKYLKQDSTELSHITATITTLALASYNISFKVSHNEKIIFDLPKVTDLNSRISDVFGKSTSEAMIPVFYGGSEIGIDGFIGKPVLSRSTSQHQYFFVNGRAISHFVLANTIKSAFHSMLMEDKKPVFVINIKIDPSLIDVNVHPRKLEIRFEDQQTIIKIIYNCVKSALEKHNLIPKAYTESQRYMSDKFPENNFSKTSYSSQESFSIQDALSFSKNILTERDLKPLQQTDERKSSMKSVSQISNSYIVAESDENLVLIDQHAAHERIRYEQLMDQFENQKKSVQPLLVPMQLELTTQELQIVEENKEVFENLGFEIEPFGGNTFIVQAVPGFLSSEDIDQVIKGVLDDIFNEKNPSNVQGNVEQILTYMACRSAIKFGKKLSSDEMQSLLVQLETLKRPYTCPHGRPTMISLTLSELDKMFGRK